MDCFDANEKIADVLKNNILQTKENQSSNLSTCYSELEFVNEMMASPEIRNNCAIDVFFEVQNDLLTSIILSCEGFYRNAYICLRSSIELVMSFIFYYDHQYDYILWKNDCIDMTWSKLIDENSGVFNEKFFKIIVDKEVDLTLIKERIMELYHLCSQSVHGKYEYMQIALSDKIQYDVDLFTDYQKLFCDVLEIIKAILYLRFYMYISRTMDVEDVNSLNQIMIKYEVIE